jgi:hypothetical protein
MSVLIQLFFTVVGALYFRAVFRAPFGIHRLTKLPPLTRRTCALFGAWFLFGAALVARERRADFTRASDYDRLQQSRKVAAVLSVFAIASFGWDMRRRGQAPP